MGPGRMGHVVVAIDFVYFVLPLQDADEERDGPNRSHQARNCFARSPFPCQWRKHKTNPQNPNQRQSENGNVHI